VTTNVSFAVAVFCFLKIYLPACKTAEKESVSDGRRNTSSAEYLNVLNRHDVILKTLIIYFLKIYLSARKAAEKKSAALRLTNTNSGAYHSGEMPMEDRRESDNLVNSTHNNAQDTNAFSKAAIIFSVAALAHVMHCRASNESLNPASNKSLVGIGAIVATCGLLKAHCPSPKAEEQKSTSRPNSSSISPDTNPPQEVSVAHQKSDSDGSISSSDDQSFDESKRVLLSTHPPPVKSDIWLHELWSRFPSFPSSVSLPLPSFWGTALSKERQSYRQALAEYTQEVAQQTDQIKAVQEALAQCLEAYETENRALRQQHELQLLMQQHEMKDNFLEEIQGEPKPSIEDEKINQQAEQLRQQLTSYPELSEDGSLSTDTVLTTLEARRKHHVELLALAEQFIPANFLNLVKGDTPAIRR
jgi:hypothetical protein